MSKRKSFAGTTNNMFPIFVQDTSSTTGAGLAITHASSGLVAEYRRYGQSSWTAITVVSGTLGTFVSGGLIADGSLTGAYEFCPPDAAFAAGARSVNVRLRGVANMLPVLMEFELDAVDYQNATNFGLSDLATAKTSTDTLLTRSGGSSGNVNVLPYTGAVVDRVTGTKITVFVQEEVSVTIGVTDADGNDVSLTSKTLQFVTEDQYGADVAVIADGSISKSGNDATITIGTPITDSIAQYHWSLRDITTANVVLAHGVLQVAYAAQEDA